MNDSALSKCILFQNLSPQELHDALDSVSGHIQCYEKNETVFHLMDKADRIGIILDGHLQAQKTFPNGSQVNVRTFSSGDMIGSSAAFSSSPHYPCDLVTLTPSTVMMFHKADILSLMQKNIRILENFTTWIATATYMLQRRLELFSYSGIAQKAAFYLLIQAKQSGKLTVKIPKSITRWAMLMNVSRSSLHRELKKMEAIGIITYAPPVIKIHDQNALQNILGR